MSVAALMLAAVLGSVTEYPSIESVQVHVGDDASWSDPMLDDRDWAAMNWWRVDPQGKLMWLRAHIDLPESFDANAEPFAVQVSATASYEAWWNGVRVGSNGVPAASAAGETPGKLDTEVFIPPHLLKSRNVLALRMSSFHLSRTLRGPMHALAVKRYGNTTSEVVRARALPFVASGALLLGALYFAAMFISNRRDRTSLLLALLSLTILGQLIAESARAFFAYDYPLHILRVEAILACAALGSVLLVAYIASRYAPEWRARLIGAVIVCAGVSIAFGRGYDGKTAFVILAAILLSLVAAIAGLRRKEPGALTIILAMCGALVLFFLDATAFLDQTYYVAATVLILILFGQQVRALREAQARRARLELELLKRQFQPHFLMNSLTALSEWVESEPALGVQMIEALADEFRAVTTMSGATTVTVAQELALCRHHLKVMSLRTDRNFVLHADGVAPEGLVPPAIFHTLIENAITHNDYAGGAGFRLEESSARGKRVYRLHSPRMPSRSAPAGLGTGHLYVRARLIEAFGKRWRFSSGPNGAAEWIDVIEVPAS